MKKIDVSNIEEMPRLMSRRLPELTAAARNFIIVQSMKGRNYISFRHLLDTVDAKLLSDYVHAIISTVYIQDREVTAIEFCNGLYVNFKRTKPE